MQIINRFAKKVIYESKKETVKEALIEAVKKKIDLKGADLGGADLGGADLGGANLGDANLEYANLKGANLKGANLGGANLEYANLGDANFYRTKIKKSQTEQFLKKIGIVVEE